MEKASIDLLARFNKDGSAEIQWADGMSSEEIMTGLMTLTARFFREYAEKKEKTLGKEITDTFYRNEMPKRFMQGVKAMAGFGGKPLGELVATWNDEAVLKKLGAISASVKSRRDIAMEIAHKDPANLYVKGRAHALTDIDEMIDKVLEGAS